MTEPVEVYELTGSSPIRRRLQAAVARGLTKFVGRDTEIEALDQARERAEAGHGQVVAAVGEAGVGKSRLVYEFVHSHRTQGWLVWFNKDGHFDKSDKIDRGGVRCRATRGVSTQRHANVKRFVW